MQHLVVDNALWSDTDYVANIRYNARFQRGLDGWIVDGAATVRTTSGGATLHTAPGGRIGQRVIAAGREAGFAPGQRGTLCVEGRSLAADAARVTAGGLSGEEIGLTLPPGGARQCAEAPLAAEFELSLRSGLVPVEIGEVQLYRHRQDSRRYRSDGSPGPQVETIRTLNRELARRVAP